MKNLENTPNKILAKWKVLSQKFSDLFSGDNKHNVEDSPDGGVKISRREFFKKFIDPFNDVIPKDENKVVSNEEQDSLEENLETVLNDLNIALADEQKTVVLDNLKLSRRNLLRGVGALTAASVTLLIVRELKKLGYVSGNLSDKKYIQSPEHTADELTADKEIELIGSIEIAKFFANKPPATLEELNLLTNSVFNSDCLRSEKMMVNTLDKTELQSSVEKLSITDDPVVFRNERERLRPDMRSHTLYVGSDFYHSFQEIYQKTRESYQELGIEIDSNNPDFSEWLAKFFDTLNSMLEGVEYKFGRVNVIVVEDELLKDFRINSSGDLVAQKQFWWPNSTLGKISPYQDSISTMDRSHLDSNSSFSREYYTVVDGIFMPGYLLQTMMKDYGMYKPWTFTAAQEEGLAKVDEKPAIFYCDLGGIGHSSPKINNIEGGIRYSGYDLSCLKRFPKYNLGSKNPLRRLTISDGVLGCNLNSDEANLVEISTAPERLKPGFALNIETNLKPRIEFYSKFDDKATKITENYSAAKKDNGNFIVSFTNPEGGPPCTHYKVVLGGVEIIIPESIVQDLCLDDPTDKKSYPNLNLRVYDDVVGNLPDFQSPTYAMVTLTEGEMEALKKQKDVYVLADAEVNLKQGGGYQAVWIIYDGAFEKPVLADSSRAFH